MAVTTLPVQQIAEWLMQLIDPGGIHELRLPSAGGMSGFYSDPSAMARDAFQASQNAAVKAVYWSLNPVQRDLLERSENKVSQARTGMSASDKDIVHRRWMLLDFDPVRTGDCSSTNEEKAKAKAEELCRNVFCYLTDQGWPAPLIADSGNGWHLLYRVDLPAADGDLVKRCLNALADKFRSDFVEVDRKVCNASRICKLYGTISRKGPDTAERPHRVSAIISIPEHLEIVPAEKIEAIIPRPARNLEKYRT